MASGQYVLEDLVVGGSGGLCDKLIRMYWFKKKCFDSIVVDNSKRLSFQMTSSQVKIFKVFTG